MRHRHLILTLTDIISMSSLSSPSAALRLSRLIDLHYTGTFRDRIGGLLVDAGDSKLVPGVESTAGLIQPGKFQSLCLGRLDLDFGTCLALA